MTTQGNAIPTDRYWCTLSPEEGLGAAVKERFERYLSDLEASGRMEQLRLARERYYGGDHSGARTTERVSHGGEQGETSELTINHYGSIITSLLSLTTAQRPAFSAAARDDSAEAMASVQLADQLVEHELERGAEAELVDGVRRMLIFQETGIGVFWHAERGDVVAVEDVPELGEDGQPIMEDFEVVEDVDEGAVDEAGAPVITQRATTVQRPRMTQRPVRAGALVSEAISPHNLARDIGERSIRDLSWIIVRRPVNRWDLAADYPEHSTTIIAAPSVTDDDRQHGPARGQRVSARAKETDQVYTLELYRERSSAVQNGRYARVIGDTVLEHGDLQYERLPVGVHSPERTMDEATGSARTIDLLGPQQGFDAVASNMMSISDTFGRPNVLEADGQDIDVDEIGDGLSLITYKMVDGAPPPAPMERPQITESDVKFIEFLRGVMEVLSGVNPVVRGDPQESLKSGAALALVSAQAVQHNSGLQRANAEMLRDWAQRVLETYRAFADAKQIIEVTGTDETRTAREFVGSDLEHVLSVRVDIGNPLMRTIAGKKELADFYSDPQRWQNDRPFTRAEHYAFMTSGRLQTLWRSPRLEAIAIREENEALSRGEQVMVAVTDHHESHIFEHAGLISGKRRMELAPDVILAIDAHIAAHGAKWVELTMTNPALLAATGQRPAPMPMMPAAPPDGAAPGAPGGPPGASAGPGAPPDQGGPQAPPPGVPELPGPGGPEQGGAAPRMPQMPRNPATGQRAPQPNGGT